jgi:hypothetical protein
LANVKITDLTAATTPLAGSELLEIVQGGASRKVAASDIAASAANVRTVATGGTGAATLTGFVKGNGTSAMTAVATVSLTTEVSGTLPVASGGTGAATLTGYVKGNGTSAMTAAATVPFADLAGRAFAQPSSLTDQTGNVAAATAVTFDTDLTGTGISVVASTQITFAVAGTYMLSPSIQFKNADSADHDATVWFRKNGTNIANSATILTIPKTADGGLAVFSLSFFETVTAGQYIEIMWLPEDVDVTIDFTAAGAIAPAIPAIICPAMRIA